MTGKLETLRALHDAVKAGTIDGNTPHCDLPARHVLGAYAGSLDAANALHKAVLPGWAGSLDTEGFAKVGKGSRGVQTVMYAERIDGHPARAWLLAILSALIAQEEAGVIPAPQKEEK